MSPSTKQPLKSPHNSSEGHSGDADAQSEEDFLKELTSGTGTTPEAFRKFMEGDSSVSDECDQEDDYDYSDRYTPPERMLNPLILDPDDCVQPILAVRKQMLNPELDRYDLDKLAQMLAQFVSSSGELESRIVEIKAGRPYSGNTLASAMRSEYEALIEVQQDKQLTANRFGESSSVMAVSKMFGNTILGQPIDLLELKTQMEDQMKSLSDSGANRQDKLAMLALLAEQAGQALMIESASARTGEAKAMILKSAVSNLATAAKIVEQLHNLSTPVGTVVEGEHIEDRQLPNKTKKLSEPNTGDAS